MTELGAPLVLLFVCSALTSYVATAIVRTGATHIGLVDVPDDRKLHGVATPRLGGLAIIFGFGFPLLLLAANPRAAELVTKNLSYLFAVLASGSLDRRPRRLRRPDRRERAEEVRRAVRGGADPGRLRLPLHRDLARRRGLRPRPPRQRASRSLWIVGVMNAMNFIDGMDSLATVVSLTIAAAFTRHRHPARRRLLARDHDRADRQPDRLLSRGTSRRRRSSWATPAALFIGLLLAAGSIARPSKSPTALIIVGPMLALALPVIDTLIVMKQRFGGERTSARRAHHARLHRRPPPHPSHPRREVRQHRQGDRLDLARDAALRRRRGA